MKRFVPLPGYNGHYEIARDGTVRATHSYNWRVGDRIVAPWHDKDGYLNVTIYRSNRKQNLKLHRLLLMAFVGPPPAGRPLAAHKNDRNSDNRISNLVWASARENSAMAEANGKNLKGEARYNAILTAAIVREIRIRLSRGDRGSEVAAALGLSRQCVSSVKLKHIWRHVK
jgi:hypothetical protein